MVKWERIDACAGRMHALGKMTCCTWGTWPTLSSRNAFFGMMAHRTSHGLHQDVRACGAVPLLQLLLCLVGLPLAQIAVG